MTHRLYRRAMSVMSGAAAALASAALAMEPGAALEAAGAAASTLWEFPVRTPLTPGL